MSKGLHEYPTVRLFIEGLILLFFRQDEGGRRFCRAAVLRDAEGHDFDLSYMSESGVTGRLSRSDVRHGLRLDVPGTETTGVTFKDESKIDRQSGPTDSNRASIDWLLDFETELYKEKIGVNPDKLRPVLNVNGGVFYTSEISRNNLLVRRKDAPTGEEPTLVGKVATRIAADINLDVAGRKVVLWHGSKELFSAGPGEHWLVALKLSPPPGHDHKFDRDPPPHANLYYSAIGHKLEDGKKLLFSSDGNKVGPEATCLNGRMGLSDTIP